jgi:probable rRNA maturation factor
MIVVEADASEEWDSRVDWRDLSERAVRAALGASGFKAWLEGSRTAEISVKLTSDSEVHRLNATWRRKDSPTDVLSFPMVDASRLQPLGPPGGEDMLLGDIVLAHGVCASEAREKGIALADHVAHLVVHGTLHLLGYDHESGEQDATAMEALERKALARLGIADPYLSEVRS